MTVRRRRTPSIRPAVCQVLLWNPNQELLAINNWTNITVTENFDGPSVVINVPASRPEIARVSELVSDVIIRRNKTDLWRMRVVDVSEQFTEKEHLIQMTCTSYENLLSRRILYDDFLESRGQFDMAWQMIDETQARQTLGLHRVTAEAGEVRTKTIRRGSTVSSSINELASAEAGFDWWVDSDLGVHFQSPRKESIVDIDLRWGTNVSTVTRQSFALDYAMSALVLGSQQEVTIPRDVGPPAVYPPPDPIIIERSSAPLGRWERTFSHPDILTEESLLERANHHISNSSVFRPNYRLSLAPGTWEPDIRTGSIMNLIVHAPPRHNFRVPVRVEELQVTFGSDGGEYVLLAVKAETPEVQSGDDTLATNPEPSTPPAGAIIVSSPAPSGKTYVSSRTGGVNALASFLKGLADRSE